MVIHPSLRQPRVLFLTVLMSICAIGALVGGLVGHIVNQPGSNRVFWLLLVAFFAAMPFVYLWRVRIRIGPDWVDIRDVSAPTRRVRRQEVESLRRLGRNRGVLWFFDCENRSIGVIRDVWTKRQIAELCELLCIRFEDSRVDHR